MDDTLNGGKPYTSPFKRFGRVETLEDAKQLIYVPHIEADSIILDEHHRFIVVSIAAAYFDLRLRARAREFDGIRNQID